MQRNDLMAIPHQLVSRRDHGGGGGGGGGAHIAPKDEDRVAAGWAEPGGTSNDGRSVGGRGGVVRDGDGVEESPGSGDASRKPLPVHLPNLQ